MDSHSESSLPLHKRLLPIRKGQYDRRFVGAYIHLPEGSFRTWFHNNDSQYECLRQLLLRRWLVKQLEAVSRLGRRGHAYITGEEYDLELDTADSIADDDLVLFEAVLPTKPQPDPRLVHLGRRLKKPWEHSDVRARYLGVKYNLREPRTRRARNRQPLPFRFTSPKAKEAVRRLMCLDQGPPIWSVGLFVAKPEHTFAVIVTLIRQDRDGVPVCILDDILILDTVIAAKSSRASWVGTDSQEAIAIAMALKSVSQTPQDLFELVNRTRRPTSTQISGHVNLQQHEDHGFCQHWNTYFLYQILVMREDPEQMYERLLSMEPDERWRLIVDFANNAVSLPVQQPPQAPQP